MVSVAAPLAGLIRSTRLMAAVLPAIVLLCGLVIGYFTS